MIRTFGFPRARIYDWLAAYREGGIEALRVRKATELPPKPDGYAVRWVYDTVARGNTLQFKFAFALWTRAKVQQLIRQRFGVRLSERSVGRLLRQPGWPPQWPQARADQRDPARVQQWLTEAFPRIQTLAKIEGAQIFFADDEAGMRPDCHSGTSWAPVGPTPEMVTTGARFKLNLISAIGPCGPCGPCGPLRFMCAPDRLTAAVFVAFLQRLLHGAH